MSRSPSAKLESTWGTFATQPAAKPVQTKLEEAGVKPEKITLEVEEFQSAIR